MSVWGDRLTAVLATAVAVWMVWIAWDFPANGDIFPKFICATILVISALLILRSVSAKSVYERRRIHVEAREEVLPLLLTAAMVVYVLIIFVVGYYTTTALFLVALSLAVGTRSVRAIALATAITLPLLYLFFELFLGANMPSGLLI